MKRGRKKRALPVWLYMEDRMERLKSAWLEVVFGLLIIIVGAFSVTNSVHEMKIDHGKHLQQSGTDLGTMGMDAYLETIKKLDDCTAIITVKDIQGYFTTQAMIDELKSMGFDQADALLDGDYRSFIGIWSSGKAVWQQIGDREDIEYYGFVNNRCIYAESAVGASGRGYIHIDGVQYAVNNRGFNIVVVDDETDTLIDSVAYDVYVSDIPVYRMSDGIATMIDSTVKE